VYKIRNLVIGGNIVKKSIISSLVASTLLLIGSIAPVVVSADTTTAGVMNLADKGTLTTSKMAFLFSLNGNSLTQVASRALGPNSAWIYDKSIKGADGLTYYRVSTNEWVGSDELSQINGTGSNISRTKTTIYIGNWSAAVLDANGNKTGNILPARSAWVAFDDQVTINGGSYYQIGSDQYVSTYDTGSAPVVNIDTNNNNTTTDTSYSGSIIGNSDSKIYHVPGQRGYNIKAYHTVYFNTEQDAINAGYRKAKV